MKSVLLIGLGRFGQHVARKLNDLGHQVMAVDSDEERVNGVLDYVTSAQIGDSTSREFLSALDIPSFDACIVTIGDNFQSSLETTDLLKELGASKVIAAPRTISWTTSSWTATTPSLSCPFRRSGRAKRSSSWTCGKNTESTYWGPAGRAGWI